MGKQNLLSGGNGMIVNLNLKADLIKRFGTQVEATKANNQNPTAGRLGA